MQENPAPALSVALLVELGLGLMASWRHGVRFGSTALPPALGPLQPRALQLDEVRREVTAVRMCLAELADLDDAGFDAHPFGVRRI